MNKPALRTLAPLFLVCLLSSSVHADGGYDGDYGGDTTATAKKPDDPRARIEKARADARARLEKARSRIGKVSLATETYGIEDRDWNVPPTPDLRSRKFHAPTPLTHATARTITTKALRDLMLGPEPPILIDVLGGQSHRTLPGAIWLKDLGLAPKRAKNIEKRLTVILDHVTDGDRSRTLVFFCLSAECWLSYNAALRPAVLGYQDVRWYRGGTKAWEKAKLPMVWAKKTKW